MMITVGLAFLILCVQSIDCFLDKFTQQRTAWNYDYTKYHPMSEFLCFLTIHSARQLLLMPYGHPQISAPNSDELRAVGQAAAKAMKTAHGMNYKVGTSPEILYPNSGSSRDWARLIGIPFSYTFELRDTGEFGHLLPEDQIQPACEEAFEGARFIITYAHDKAFHNRTEIGAAGAARAAWATVLASSIAILYLL